MKNKKSPSNVAIAVVSLVAIAAALGCSSDDKNDNPFAAGEFAVAGSSSNATSGTSGKGSKTDESVGGAASDPSGGAGNHEDTTDYTTCAAQTTCDADAELGFDFSGSWNESLVFTSNDCDPSLQSLLPQGFMMNDAIFTDVIVGNCFRMTPDSETYTGTIALDLSGAEYCATSKYAVGDPIGDIDLISHVKWTSIKDDKITGTSAVYAAQAGCTLVGDYTLTRSEK